MTYDSWQLLLASFELYLSQFSNSWYKITHQPNLRNEQLYKSVVNAADGRESQYPNIPAITSSIGDLKVSLCTVCGVCV